MRQIPSDETGEGRLSLRDKIAQTGSQCPIDRSAHALGQDERQHAQATDPEDTMRSASRRQACPDVYGNGFRPSVNRRITLILLALAARYRTVLKFDTGCYQSREHPGEMATLPSSGAGPIVHSSRHRMGEPKNGRYR